MRRKSALVTVTCLLLLMVMALPAIGVEKVITVDQFADVKGHSWGEEVMTDMINLGVVKGEQRNGRYYAMPEQSITRWEFAVFLARALDLPAGKELPFTDAKSIPPVAQPYVAALYDNKIISGVPNSDGSFSFKPNNNVKRAEIVKMLYNALNDKQEKEIENPFKDVHEEADAWVYKELLATYDMGIIQGWTKDKFVPYENATRVQVMAILSRFLAKDTANPPSDKELEDVVKRFYDKIESSVERGKTSSNIDSYLTGQASAMQGNGISLLERPNNGSLEKVTVSHPVWPPTVTLKSDRLAELEGRTKVKVKDEDGNELLDITVTEIFKLRNVDGSWKIYSIESEY